MDFEFEIRQKTGRRRSVRRTIELRMLQIQRYRTATGNQPVSRNKTRGGKPKRIHGGGEYAQGKRYKVFHAAKVIKEHPGTKRGLVSGKIRRGKGKKKDNEKIENSIGGSEEDWK